MKRSLIWIWILALLLTGCTASGGQTPPEDGADTPEITEPSEVAAEQQNQEEELAVSYWDEPLKQLKTDEGYGTLVPYIGKEERIVTDADTSGWDFYWYGLATADGRIVTEPVYAVLEQLWYNAPDGSNGRIPVYQLWTEKFWESDEPRLCAVAALDGSWCTEQSYLWAGAVGPDRVVLMDQEYRLWFCDLEGNITPTAVDQPITDLWRILFPNSVSLTSVMELNCAPDEKGAWFVNLETGAEVYFENGGGSEWNRQGELFVLSTEDGYGYIDDQGNWILEQVYAWADDFYGSYGLVQRTHGGPFELIDATGQTVLSADGGVSAYLVNGSVYWIAADAEGRTVEIRDQNLQVVDLPVVGARNFYAENALAWCDEDGKKWYWDGTAVHAYPDDSLQLDDCQDGLALFRVLEEDAPARTGLYDITEERWILPLAPRGHCFLYQSGGDVFLSADSTAIYDRSGKEVVSAPLISLPVEGVFQVIDGDWTGLVDRTGQWILRIPLETTRK